MLGNTSPLYSEDETDSELYVDAEDEIKTHNGELEAYHSTINIPETALEIGVYSQIVETRIVFTNGHYKAPERKPRNLEETILTCQMMARKCNQKPVCAICGNPTVKCTCNVMKTLLESPAGCSKSKKDKLCMSCKQPLSRCICKTTCRGRSNNADIISLLRGIQQLSLPQRNPCLLPPTRPRTRLCSAPTKFDHPPCDKVLPTQMHKSSLSNCGKVHLLNNLRAYKLPETFYQNKCLACKKSLTKCVCGTQRPCSEVCRECEESIPQCKCHKWKGLKEFNRRNQCSCGPAKVLNKTEKDHHPEPEKTKKPKKQKVPQKTDTPKIPTAKPAGPKDAKKPGPKKEEQIKQTPSKSEKKVEKKGEQKPTGSGKPKPEDKKPSKVSKFDKDIKDKPKEDKVKKPPKKEIKEEMKEEGKGDEGEIAEVESVECVLPEEIEEPEPEPEIVEEEEEGQVEEIGEDLQEIEVVVTPEDAVQGDIVIEKTSEEIKITIDISDDQEVEYIEEEPVEEVQIVEEEVSEESVEEEEEEEELPEIKGKLPSIKEEKISIESAKTSLKIEREVRISKTEEKPKPEKKKTSVLKVKEEPSPPKEESPRKEEPPLPPKEEPPPPPPPKEKTTTPPPPREEPPPPPKEKKVEEQPIFEETEQFIILEEKLSQPQIKHEERYSTPRGSVKEEEIEEISIHIEEEQLKLPSVDLEQAIIPPVEQPQTPKKCFETKSCRPCKEKCKKCSKIPISNCRTLSKLCGTGTRKMCHCCSVATNTRMIDLEEKEAQWDHNFEGKVCPCKTCRERVMKQDNVNQMGRSGDERSSTFNLSDKIEDQPGRGVRSCGVCTKSFDRPSTANKIYDHRGIETSCVYKSTVKRSCSTCRPFGGNESSDIGASTAQFSIPLNDMSSNRCAPCTEIFERNAPPKKDENTRRVCQCHRELNKNQQTLVSRAQQCSKRSLPSKVIKCKQCSQSQTGGTPEQDMIASYVASCTTNPENPPPQTFITQTLLYQFAGHDVYRELIPHRRRRSFDTPRSRNIASSSFSLNRYLSMRSVQIQATANKTFKCEEIQTITTFILSDQSSALSTGIIPTDGQINYICGPDVPGIRTKIAMNLNDLSPNEDEVCICGDQTEDEEPAKSLEGCASSVCSYFKNKNSDDTEEDENSDQKNKKPICKVFKNDKYVFITVTPVQTEPYEPNYYIILTTPKEKSRSEGQSRIAKPEKSGTKRDCKKRKPTEPQSGPPHAQPKTKEPMERSKKQIFSVETLKSREFMELVNKQQELLKNATLLEPPSDFPASDDAKKQIEALKKFEIECTQLEEPPRDIEDKKCGPDDCTNLQKTCKLLAKDQSTECSLGKEKTTKNTVACGSFVCLHRKMNEEEEIDESKNSNPPKYSDKKSTKNTRCGPDAYCAILEVEEDAKEKKCKLLQSIVTYEKDLRKPPAKPDLVTVGCDAPCALVQNEVQETQCCDADITCDKEDSANQVSFEGDSCEPENCEKKLSDKMEICQKCILNKRRGDSCDQACAFSVFCADQAVMAPDPEECNDKNCGTLVENDEDNTKQECSYKHPKKSEDIVIRCEEPPIVQSSRCTIRKGERIDKVEECTRPHCPIKNTRLDFNDKFALEIAMNRFIKTNMSSEEEDENE